MLRTRRREEEMKKGNKLERIKMLKIDTRIDQFGCNGKQN